MAGTLMATGTLIAGAPLPMEQQLPPPAQHPSWWPALLGVLWGTAVAVCVAGLALAALKWRSSKRRGNPGVTAQAGSSLTSWGISAAVIVGAGVVLGGLLWASSGAVVVP